MRAGNWSRTTSPVVGFAANRRFIAAAVGESQPSLRVHRLDRSPLGLVCSEAWIARMVAITAPRLVVLVIEDESCARRRDDHIEDQVRALCARRRIAVFEVVRQEVARSLGIGAGTTSAICRLLARREGIAMKALGPRGRGPRSERVRHWELAVVALAGIHAACAITRHREPRHDEGPGSCAPNT